MLMLLYSALLAAGLAISSPWWLLRMAMTERYREGLRERLGRVPARLRAYVASVGAGRVIWVHAVSVGEVLAASRLVADLGEALGAEWKVVISTTTRTGQALARERFGAERVFYFPLDFAWAVRCYLRVLRPAALVLMESEIWPRMLHECAREKIPVAVVNARVSDRSFKRAMKLRVLWGRALKMVSLWLAQSKEDARRLVKMGASAESVRVDMNLKYDVLAAKENVMTKRIGSLLWKARLVIAGSTSADEEEILLQAWPEVQRASPDAVLLIAPRHPDRFDEVVALVRKSQYPFFRCSHLLKGTEPIFGGTILVLDTIGDLSTMYSLGSVAFVGGSLTQKGGHNPLEPAQFSVPVLMGPSYENFRGIVTEMSQAEGIRIVQNGVELQKILVEVLSSGDVASELGERGRRVFEAQQGATKRAVEAIVGMVKP